jgi:hypothetical protein
MMMTMINDFFTNLEPSDWKKYLCT